MTDKELELFLNLLFAPTVAKKTVDKKRVEKKEKVSKPQPKVVKPKRPTVEVTPMSREEEIAYNLGIREIHANEIKKAVTVMFNDGDVKVIKCDPKDDFDVSVGVALCLANHLFGSKTKYKKYIKSHTTVKKVPTACEDTNANTGVIAGDTDGDHNLVAPVKRTKKGI